VELGLKPGDRVGLFAPNCPEWHTADLAISGSGGVTVPIYFNESPDRMSYILNHSGSQILFISGAKQLKKFLQMRDTVKDVQQVIVANAGNDLPVDFLRYETLIASTGPSEIAAYRLRAAKVLPSQLATLIYTSGTTGEPKGVMLTHSNFCSNVVDSCADLDLYPETDLAVSFLPLAHVYGRMLDYLYIFHGCPVAYVDVVENVAQALLEIFYLTLNSGVVWRQPHCLSPSFNCSRGISAPCLDLGKTHEVMSATRFHGDRALRRKLRPL
jgi:long-chain acyl-CoA synthetase